MLKINKKRGPGARRLIAMFIALALLGTGLYLLILVASPTIAPLIIRKPIDVKSLPAPKKIDNRIIIPKIGVNIAYGSESIASLDRGAWWRYPDRGNPEKGGNFIIAAHRFSIQPTPRGTIEKSPFYSIDKIIVGDKIVVDYEGKRYGYEVTKTFDVKPSQIEIEAPSTDAKLTLYSCELGGSESGRIVVVAKLLGEVALSSNN